MLDSDSKRINELEAKTVFQEDSIERLSKELRIQQIEIIKLKDELAQMKELNDEPIIDGKSVEKPPHY
jgi:uncharacterized coiled-coil protein SlyX